ncbi:hypothetical protein Pelo_1060 [Pelomyxa schiedti]|nr:hypothetical protein Pelo_1060 [Pelomyxa schiedti]
MASPSPQQQGAVPPLPQCSVCGGLGCPITDPVLFPASKSAASSSSSSSTPSSSSSSCGHVVCRGCYRHIASVATLMMLHERAPLCMPSVSLSGGSTHNCNNEDQQHSGEMASVSSTPLSLPGVSVKCPVLGCGVTSLRVSDVSMLIPDVTTRDHLLQVMKEKEEEPEEGLCMLGYCMDENSVAKKATMTCLRCKGMLFCESCFHIHHKAPGIKSHKGEPITTSPVLTEEHKCPKHPKKDLDLFCLEERDPICSLCAFSSAHSTHKCVPLDEIGPQIRESILSVTPKLEEVVALERDAIKKCEASILESEKTLQSIASNVETETNSILHSMKQKTSEVVADCTMISSLIEAHVKEHKECLEVCMSTHQRIITRAHEIAKSSDVVSLIAAEKKLKEILLQYNLQLAERSGGTCVTMKALKDRVVQLEDTLEKERIVFKEMKAQLETKQTQLTTENDSLKQQLHTLQMQQVAPLGFKQYTSCGRTVVIILSDSSKPIAEYKDLPLTLGLQWFHPRSTEDATLLISTCEMLGKQEAWYKGHEWVITHGVPTVPSRSSFGGFEVPILTPNGNGVCDGGFTAVRKQPCSFGNPEEYGYTRCWDTSHVHDFLVLEAPLSS